MRVFVGVELDDAVRAAAATAAEQVRVRLRRAGADIIARWIETENLHVTVWFIGEVTGERAAEVQQAVQPRFRTSAFDMRVRGCGAFPLSGPPRVFWLGVAAGADSMTRVYAELTDRLVAIGFEAEKRPFSPHVTLARVKDAPSRDGRAVREALAAVPADCGVSRVEAVTLFRSHLSPRGSRYEPLLRVPLS